MKRNLILFTMIVAVLGLTSIAAAQERDMERSFGTRFGPTQVGRPGYVTMLIRFSDQLELSSDQVEKLRSIATSFQKEAVQVQADIKVAEIELREMVADKGVNITDVETKIKGIESLRSSLRFSMTKAQIDGRNLLSDEQLEKIGSLRT